MLGFGGTLGMLRGNPDVAELIEVPAGSGWVASRRLIAPSLAPLRPGADRAVLGPRPPVRLRRGEAAQPARSPTSAKSWWKRALLEHRVRMNDDQSHSVVEKLRLLAPWVEPRGARLVAPPATPLPGDVAAALRPPYAVLQAPAAVAYKLWPLAHWRALVAALLERGLQVVLTGAPSAGDRALVAAGRASGQRERSRPRRRRTARPEPGRRAAARRRALRRRRHLDHAPRRRLRRPGGRALRPDRPALLRPVAAEPDARGPVSSATPWCSAPAPSRCCRERRPACPATGPAARTATTAPASAWRRWRPARVVAEVDRILGRAR